MKPMFAVYCPRHHAQVLLSPSDIEAIVNAPSALELHWRCSCGEAGVERIERASRLSWAAS
jgi:hypothetical protein